MKRAIDINELIDWEAGELNADHEARNRPRLAPSGSLWEAR